MKMLFSMKISSISVRGSDMIVLDDVLKIWIELIKLRNDNIMDKFYRFRVVWKSSFFVEISNISKNIQNFKNI